MKSTAFCLLFLLVGALAISKRSDDDNGQTANTVTASVGVTSGVTIGTTANQTSTECAQSSSNVLIQLAETLGRVIGLLLQPVLQLLGFNSVRQLLEFVVNLVTDLLNAVLQVPSTSLLTGSPEVVLQGYPSLLSLIGILVNILQVPLGLVGSLLAAVFALLSALL